MTSEIINTVREALTTEPQTVPAIRHLTGMQMQTIIDALCLLRGNGEAICTEERVDGRLMTVWARVAEVVA